MRRFFDDLTWGPFYFLRVLACRVLGHRWEVEEYLREGGRYATYCWRCMEEP